MTDHTDKLQSMLPIGWSANTLRDGDEPDNYTALLNLTDERDWALLGNVCRNFEGEGWKARLEMNRSIVGGRMGAHVSVGGNTPANALGKAIAQMRAACGLFESVLGELAEA